MAKATVKINKKLQTDKVGGQGFKGADTGMVGESLSGAKKVGGQGFTGSIKKPSKKLITTDTQAMTDFVGTTEFEPSAFQGTDSVSDSIVKMEMTNEQKDKAKEELVMRQLRGEPDPVVQEEQVKPVKKKASVKKSAAKAPVKKTVKPGKVSYRSQTVDLPVLGPVASGKY